MPQLRCKHCSGIMEFQFDRKKCLICGRSEWHQFAIRKPLKEEMKLDGGRPIGSGVKGSDNIQARI